MQSFSTKEVRHEFSIDGAKYFIPGIAIGDFEEMVRIDALELEEQIIGFREMLAERARKASPWQWRSGRSAVAKLSPSQCTELFRAWVGFGESTGESSASPDSQ